MVHHGRADPGSSRAANPTRRRRTRHRKKRKEGREDEKRRRREKGEEEKKNLDGCGRGTQVTYGWVGGRTDRKPWGREEKAGQCLTWAWLSEVRHGGRTVSGGIGARSPAPAVSAHR